MKPERSQIYYSWIKNNSKNVYLRMVKTYFFARGCILG